MFSKWWKMRVKRKDNEVLRLFVNNQKWWEKKYKKLSKLQNYHFSFITQIYTTTCARAKMIFQTILLFPTFFKSQLNYKKYIFHLFSTPTKQPFFPLFPPKILSPFSYSLPKGSGQSYKSNNFKPNDSNTILI